MTLGMLSALRRTGGAFCAAICAVIAAGCASSAPGGGATRPVPVAEIPFRFDYQGWITVAAAVNGAGPYDFIVDSGATITSVFANLAARQSFSPTPERSVQILGLIGARELPVYVIGDIEFSGVRMNDHAGVILPDWAPPNTPPQGVVGLDFLTRYGVHVDTGAGVIRLYDPAAAFAPSRGWKSVKMTLFATEGSGSKLYTVTVKAGAASIPCIVDLGASGTVFNTAALREMARGVRYSTLDGRGMMSTGSHINDVFDFSDRVRPVRIDRLTIGGASWRNRVFAVYDAQIFDDLGYKKKPFCLVGADLFADRSFMFDFARGAMHIGPRRDGDDARSRPHA